MVLICQNVLTERERYKFSFDSRMFRNAVTDERKRSIVSGIYVFPTMNEEDAVKRKKEERRKEDSANDVYHGRLSAAAIETAP